MPWPCPCDCCQAARRSAAVRLDSPELEGLSSRFTSAWGRPAFTRKEDTAGTFSWGIFSEPPGKDCRKARKSRSDWGRSVPEVPWEFWLAVVA